jgi:hypothetical protein
MVDITCSVASACLARQWDWWLQNLGCVKAGKGEEEKHVGHDVEHSKYIVYTVFTAKCRRSE